MNNLYKNNYKLQKSNIDGFGLFANMNIKKNEIIGIAIYFLLGIPHITQDFGKWINHSYKPNSKLVYSEKTNKYYIVAIKNIKINEEITANYNDTPWFIQKAKSYYI